MTYRAKFLSEARHFKKKSASRVKILARRPETENFSVVAQRSDQVKAYHCYKLLIIKRKVQVLFIDKT